MAWDRRNRFRRRGPAMREAESSSRQPWACSSLSSSDKFLSLYDKMLEDCEKKNFESLVRTRCLQQPPVERFPVLLPPIEKPGSNVLFPHIISRGSVVGKKVYCSTSIQTSITWQQKSSTKQIHSSMMFLNFYRPNDILPGVRQTGSTPANSASSQKPSHSLDRGQCRGLVLKLAGAAGMRLICPPLQLPLLEILLFSLQKFSSKNKATLSKEGGLWRFPLNLALATLRPFCGSLLRHCLTALLFVSQMKTKQNIPERSLRYMPDLYSLLVFEHEKLDRKEFTICSTPIQIDGPVRTEANNDVVERASRKNGLPLFDVGDNFVEECCSNCVSGVQISSGEQTDGPPDNLPPFLEQNIGAKVGRLEKFSDISVVDVELEDNELFSPELSLQKSCEELYTTGITKNVTAPHKRLRSSEDGLEPCKRLHIAVEEARNEALVPFDFFSSSTVQIQLDFPSLSVESDWGKASGIEDSGLGNDVMTLTCTISAEMRAVEEQAESTTSLKKPCDGETCEDLAEESCSPGTECTEAALTEPVDKLQEEKIEGEQYAYFIEEKSADTVLEREYEYFLMSKERRIDDRDCVSPESLLEEPIEACSLISTSTENELEKRSPDSLRGSEVEGYLIQDANTPEKEGNNGLSSSFRGTIVGNVHEHPSPKRIGAMQVDVQSKDTGSSPDHTGTISRYSCVEHLEFNLVSSEASTDTSLISRLDTSIDTESQSLGPNNSAIAVVLEKFSRDHEDGQNEVDAQVSGIDNDLIKADDENRVTAVLTKAVAGSEEYDLLNQSSALSSGINVDQDDTCTAGMCPISSSAAATVDTESSGVAECYPEHPFADDPTCIDLRMRRHSHGDQIYIDMEELLPPPWGQLIFWHGSCKEGRPTLCVLLGKAVRQLSSQELKHFLAVTVSHLEYAELNYFKGPVKQLNILMDLEGLGFMRLPPMNILSSIGAVLNRDYAGRGGWLILVNAPVMLGFVISAIQGVILRPSYNKGAVIDSSFRGFLEGKERIMMMGSKYRPALQKHFEASMLPLGLGGDCPCASNEAPCKHGNEFLRLP